MIADSLRASAGAPAGTAASIGLAAAISLGMSVAIACCLFASYFGFDNLMLASHISIA